MIISKKYKNKNQAFDEILSPDLETLSEKEKQGWEAINSLVSGNIPIKTYIESAVEAAEDILRKKSMPLYSDEYLIEEYTKDKVYPYDAILEQQMVASGKLKSKVKSENLCIRLNLGKETPEAMAMEICNIAYELVENIKAKNHTKNDILKIVGLSFRLAGIDKNLELETVNFKDELTGKEMTPVQWKNTAIEHFRGRITGGIKTQENYNINSQPLNELIIDVANFFREKAPKTSTNAISGFIHDLIVKNRLSSSYCKLKYTEIPIANFQTRLEKLQKMNVPNSTKLSIRSISNRIKTFEKSGLVKCK